MTPKLISLLGENNLRATFYTLGSKYEGFEDLYRLLRENGHELASHSYAHCNAWTSLPWVTYSDIKKGLECLEDFSPGGTLFRPPFGKITLGSLIQILAARKHIGWWTHDSTDTNINCLRPDVIVDRVRSNRGGVVLMHDFFRKKDVDRNYFVLDLTRQLIDMAKENGLRIVTQGELRSHCYGEKK